jgi:hypothetical protein
MSRDFPAQPADPWGMDASALHRAGVAVTRQVYCY